MRNFWFYIPSEKGTDSPRILKKPNPRPGRHPARARQQRHAGLPRAGRRRCTGSGVHRGGDMAVCNGELYGFRPLKKALEAKGYVFASESDCEIILPLWQRIRYRDVCRA